MKFLSILALLMFILTAQTAYAAENDSGEGVMIENPGIDLWRAVRQRQMETGGTSQVKGVDSNIFINPRATNWTSFRVDTLVRYASIILAAIIAILFLFYMLRGKITVEGGLSGRMVQRFQDYERVLHWTLAVVFLFLAITGLTLLLGRTLLIPLFGHEVFSLLASSSKESHNLIGPVFLLSLILMIFQFARRNIYEKGDLTWLLKGGGMIGKSHVSGGFFNMGEKSWYWLVILVGLVISASGIILVSPNFGQGRVIMEWSQIVHVIGAIILIAVSLGHMYMGWVGTEGTSEGMKTGYVDIKWAESHHDRWAKQCIENNVIISADEYRRLQGNKVTTIEENS